MRGIEPSGHGLEIGGGSGMMTAQLLAMFPELKLTVTDLDRSMFADAPKDLFEGRDTRRPRRFPVGPVHATRRTDGSVLIGERICSGYEDRRGPSELQPFGLVVGLDLLITDFSL